MKPALLFSGGLDSTCALHLLADAVQPVYVRIGAPYEREELRHAQALTESLHVLDGPSLGYLAEGDGHIRHRNAALAITVATAGYRTIYLGALRGEASRDKSGAFFDSLTRLLRASEAGDWTVTAPFARLTKTGLLRRALAAGMLPDLALSTRSCYAAEGECGRCQACFRRWVALVNCGLPAGERPVVPAARWGPLRDAGVRRWPDIALNNVDALRAIMRAKGGAWWTRWS